MGSIEAAVVQLGDLAGGQGTAPAGDLAAQVLERCEADETARQAVDLGSQALFQERGGHGPAEAQGLDLGLGDGGGLTPGGPAAGGGGELVEGVLRPAAALVLARHAEEDRLPHGLTRKRGLQGELPAVDLRQLLPFRAALAGEVEKGGDVGEERLHPAALGGGEQQQGRREVPQEVAGDLGAERRGLLLVEVRARTADLGVEPAVLAAAERVGPPIAACRPVAAWPGQASSRRSSRCGSAPVISAASDVRATLISLRTPKSPVM